MDPDYFENIIARDKYRDMVQIPTFVISGIIIMVLGITDVMGDSIIFKWSIIIIITTIAYFVSRREWVKFVIKYGSSDDQIQRILSHRNHDEKNPKFDVVGLMDTVMNSNHQKSKKSIYPQPENLPTQVTLKKNVMVYKSTIVIFAIILVSASFYFFYYLIYKSEFNIISLGIVIVFSNTVYLSIKKINNNQNLLIVNLDGIYSSENGLVPWDQILDAKQVKVLKLEEHGKDYDVFLEYWTELSIMKFDISDLRY